MVPGERAVEYGIMMNRLTTSVLDDLGWAYDSVEAIGLIAATPRHGVEGIMFMEELGIDTRSVTLLVLWAETAECVNFENYVPEACGIGAVILTATGVVLPTVRMPSIEHGWWAEPLNQEFAATVYTSLIRDGRAELDEGAPFVLVSGAHAWN